jgi:hypothetical protein
MALLRLHHPDLGVLLGMITHHACEPSVVKEEVSFIMKGTDNPWVHRSLFVGAVVVLGTVSIALKERWIERFPSQAEIAEVKHEIVVRYPLSVARQIEFRRVTKGVGDAFGYCGEYRITHRPDYDLAWRTFHATKSTNGWKICGTGDELPQCALVPEVDLLDALCPENYWK